MAFIGTPLDTRNTFQSLVGKRFNGDGSTTAFTLDVAPSSTLDIEVFVGNVRQDPNSAYTLSGTTLTFTGAPPSGTNNIYVVHQAKSVGTIDPPAGATIDMNGVELILDADADTTLTADTDDQIDIKIAGTDVANITNSSSDVVITSAVQDKDIVFKGDDGGSAVTALTIDMSAAGELLQGTSAKISSNGAIANFSNHNGSASETALATSDGNEKVRCFNDGKVTIEANGSERVRIDSSGKLLINTTSTIDSDSVLQVKSTTAGGEAMTAQVHTNGNSVINFNNSSGNEAGFITVQANGSAVAYNTSSDYRLKENEVAISDGITRLKTLKPYKFNFITEPDIKVDGFFAHEVTAVPEAITGEKDGEKMQGIDQSKLVPLLTAALQEAVTKIEALEARVTALEE